jgi:ribosomal protein S18 acetylase RimI-like enzyme
MSSTQNVQLTFRPMVEADFAQVEELVQSAYRGGQASVSWKNEHDLVRGPRVTRDGLAEMLRSPEQLVLVGEVRKDEATAPELYGCVLIEREDNGTVIIGMLAVSPSSQNLGVGRKLVEAAEAAARRDFGATRAHMHVAHVREELLAWYKRLGYEPTGEAKPFPGPEAGIEALKEGLKFAVIEKIL